MPMTSEAPRRGLLDTNIMILRSRIAPDDLPEPEDPAQREGQTQAANQRATELALGRTIHGTSMSACEM